MSSDQKTHTVTTNDGVRLAVTETGSVDAPAIVFIHGLAQDKSIWRKQMESALAEKFRLISFDLRGHGESEPKEGIAYNTGDIWANDVEAIRAELGLETFVLVGWSYGANVVGDYLTHFGQEHVAGVVVVSDGPSVTPTFFTQELGALIPRLLSADAEEFSQANTAFVDLFFAQDVSADDKTALVAAEAKSPASARSAILSRQDLDVSEAYRQLIAPLLILFGSGDKVINIEEAMRMFQESNPGAQPVVYENAGHALFWEQSERFNADLQKFVESLS